MNEPFVSSHTAVVQRNPWRLGLAIAPGILPFVVAGVMRPERVDFFMIFLSGVVLLGCIRSGWHSKWVCREVAGTVHADSAGVLFRGSRLLKRSAIREGFVVPREGKAPLVKLVLRWPWSDKEIRVQDESEGRRLLQSLGLDASQTVTVFHLPSQGLGLLGVGIRFLLLSMLVFFPLGLVLVLMIRPCYIAASSTLNEAAARRLWTTEAPSKVVHRFVSPRF